MTKNEASIAQGQTALKNNRLGDYIIHAADSVLTQKKKIRYLKQLVRRKSLSHELE